MSVPPSHIGRGVCACVCTCARCGVERCAHPSGERMGRTECRVVPRNAGGMCWCSCVRKAIAHFGKSGGAESLPLVPGSWVITLRLGVLTVTVAS